VGIMSTWVLTVAGVAILINICEILMPEGEMNRYIKGTLAIVCMLVLVSPLPRLLNAELDFTEIVFGESENVGIDFSFVDYVNKLKADALAKELEIILAEKGYEGVKIGVGVMPDSAEFIAESAVLDLSDLNPPEGLSREQIALNLRTAAAEFFKISPDKVVIRNG